MYVVEKKGLISCTFTEQLICAFFFAFAKRRFSHDVVHVLPPKDWERSLQNQEGQVEQIRLSYAKLGMHSPQAESKIDFINQKWDQMITLGNTYAER